jgi:hypothetical protein
MRTRYINVRMTEKEAEALLTMARSGDYQHGEGDLPEITIPSNRAEEKIRLALRDLRRKDKQRADHRNQTGS